MVTDMLCNTSHGSFRVNKGGSASCLSLLLEILSFVTVISTNEDFSFFTLCRHNDVSFERLFNYTRFYSFLNFVYFYVHIFLPSSRIVFLSISLLWSPVDFRSYSTLNVLNVCWLSRKGPQKSRFFWTSSSFLCGFGLFYGVLFLMSRYGNYLCLRF